MPDSNRRSDTLQKQSKNHSHKSDAESSLPAASAFRDVTRRAASGRQSTKQSNMPDASEFKKISRVATSGRPSQSQVSGMPLASEFRNAKQSSTSRQIARRTSNRSDKDAKEESRPEPIRRPREEKLPKPPGSSPTEERPRVEKLPKPSESSSKEDESGHREHHTIQGNHAQKLRYKHYQRITEEHYREVRYEQHQNHQRQAQENACLPPGPTARKEESPVRRPNITPYPEHSSVPISASTPSATQAVKDGYHKPEDIKMAEQQRKITSLTPKVRKEQEDWAQEKIREVGLCPGQNKWIRIDGDDAFWPGWFGYRCKQGVHCLTDDLVAEGKGGHYIRPIMSAGLDENGDDISVPTDSPIGGPFYSDDDSIEFEMAVWQLYRKIVPENPRQALGTIGPGNASGSERWRDLNQILFSPGAAFPYREYI